MPLQPLEFVNVDCPYCGETIECEIDTSVVDQEYIEDCHVCCSPILFKVRVDAILEHIEITAQMDN